MVKSPFIPKNLRYHYVKNMRGVNMIKTILKFIGAVFVILLLIGLCAPDKQTEETAKTAAETQAAPAADADLLLAAWGEIKAKSATLDGYYGQFVAELDREDYRAASAVAARVRAGYQAAWLELSKMEMPELANVRAAEMLTAGHDDLAVSYYYKLEIMDAASSAIDQNNPAAAAGVSQKAQDTQTLMFKSMAGIYAAAAELGIPADKLK